LDRRRKFPSVMVSFCEEKVWKPTGWNPRTRVFYIHGPAFPYVPSGKRLRNYGKSLFFMGKLTMFDDFWKPLRRSLDAQYFLRCGSSSHCEVWKPFTYPNKVYISSMGDISQFKQQKKRSQLQKSRSS
jgi:hypothetical protein